MAEKFLEKLKGSLSLKQRSEDKDGDLWKSSISTESLTRLKALAKYTDIRLTLVKDLTQIVKEVGADSSSSNSGREMWMKNILKIVSCLTSKDNFGLDKFVNEKDPATSIPVEDNYIEFKKKFSELWAQVMRWKMSPSVLKEVVILLPDKIMLHLTKPLHMSHFLLESFKMGGPVGLISLHGLFLLMQQYNFDVPDFYSKLYSMFTLEVLYSKYRARFFAYSRDFLTSTHLPEYLVASFVKRLARLSLHAPAPAIPMICDFIINLMIEHPGLKTLVNKKPRRNDDGTLDANADPFLEDEPDPLKTRAMESCLWEIKTLQHHTVPTIALSGRFISKALPKVEKDLDDTLSLNYDDIFDREQQASVVLEPIPTHKLCLDVEGEDENRIFMGF